MINDEFNYPSWLYDPQLVIPATFEECLTYEMQVIWLYKKIEALGDGGGSDAIKQLQDEVAALAVRVDKNSQDITSTNNTVAGLETEINNLRSTVESYDERINTAVTTANTAKATADSALSNISTTVMPAVNRAQNTADDAAAAAAALGTSKQDKLTAGENITIDGNVISATGGGGGGTSNYYELQNRPFLQEIDLSTATPEAPLDLNTMTPGAYMLKGDGYVKNTIASGAFIEAHSGPMFLYPSGTSTGHKDALFISTGETTEFTSGVKDNLPAGTTNVRFYPYNMSTSLAYGMQVITEGNLTDTIYDSYYNYIPTTNAVKDYVEEKVEFVKSNLITNIPIPLAGTVDANNVYTYWFSNASGRFKIIAAGDFVSSASMLPSITTIEIGPLTKDEFLAFSSYNVNPPDHVVIYSRKQSNEIPYAMYWYDKVDPASTNKPWSWKYQFNASKSLYQGVTGADAMITLPSDGDFVESYAIF